MNPTNPQMKNLVSCYLSWTH